MPPEPRDQRGLSGKHMTDDPGRLKAVRRPPLPTRWLATIAAAALVALVALALKPSVAAAPATPQAPVRLDVGGVLMTLPPHLLYGAEYDGEPTNWSGKPQPRGPRTHLSSFGLELRYPDLATLSTPALKREYWERPAEREQWMRVRLTSGHRYPGNGFLDRRLKAEFESTIHRFSPLPGSHPGLEPWEVRAFHSKTGAPLPSDILNYTLHVAKSPDGTVRALIQCSISPSPRAVCEHTFTLEPRIRAKVTISYRRTLLADWRELQSAVTTFITRLE